MGLLQSGTRPQVEKEAGVSEALLEGPRLEPDGSVERLVLFTHGYGANGDDLIALGRHWQPHLPGTVFLAPNAPEVCEMSGGGYQWFPITGGDRDAMARGVASAAVGLNAFIDAELTRYGLRSEQLALVGFSQGTMMALEVGLSLAPSPIAIVGFSGAYASAPRTADSMEDLPPVMLIHGDADDTLPAKSSLAAAARLAVEGAPVQWHISHGVAHGIGPDGVEIAGKFLMRAFTGVFANAARPPSSAWPAL